MCGASSICRKSGMAANRLNQTGVIVIPSRRYGTLFNNRGYIDLDHDTEHCSKNGVDRTDCFTALRDLIHRENIEDIPQYAVYEI